MPEAKSAQARKTSQGLARRLGRVLAGGRRKLCESLALCREADPDGDPAEPDLDT